MTHGTEHEELLLGILTGELSANDPRARERLQDCAECRAELARLRALDQGLASAAGQVHADLARAAAEAGAEDEQWVRRSFDVAAAVRRRAHGGRRTPRRILGLAAAAVVLLLGAVGWRLLSREAPVGPPELLLGGDFDCSEPVGAVEHYSPFRWNHTLSPLGHYELRIFELAGEEIGREVHSELLLTEPRWTPDPELERSFPPRIHWEVRAIDEETGRSERGVARASRPPP